MSAERGPVVAPFTGSSRGQRDARHGTQSGYVIHRKAGQAACDECKEAHRVWSAAQKVRRQSGWRITVDEAHRLLAAAATEPGGAQPPPATS